MRGAKYEGAVHIQNKKLLGKDGSSYRMQICAGLAVRIGPCLEVEPRR